MIHNGQRITPGAIFCFKLPFKIRRPKVVGFMNRRKRLLGGNNTSPMFLGRDDSCRFQNIINACLRRNLPRGVLLTEQYLNLFRTWSNSACFARFNNCHTDPVWNLVRTIVRLTRFILQPIHAKMLIAIKPFVPGFPANTVVQAKRAESTASPQIIGNKQYLLVHWFHFFPGHGHLLFKVPL